MSEARSWLTAAWAICVKDLRAEFRTRYALSAVGLFAITTLTVVSLALGPFGLETELQAAVLWIVLFFAAMAGLSRVFVHEEETRTAPSLRLAAAPGAVYLGKYLFNLVLLLLLELLVVPLFIATGAGGYLFKQDRLVRVSVGVLESMVFAGLLVQVPKMLLGRARPNRELGPRYFDGPDFTDTGFHSFPSGHAAVSGSIAGVLIGEFDALWVDALAVLLAGCTAFERVYANKHWPADSFFGTAFGLAVGYSISTHRKDVSEENTGITILPLQKQDYTGIQLAILF